jgi:hypothetical protein
VLRRTRTQWWHCLAVVGCAVALQLVSARLPAEEANWRDTESRIQYGYYTQDTRALRALQDTLAADDAHERQRGYYSALAAWRLALVAADRPGSAPDTADAQRCVRELDPLLEAQADDAEGLALRAACAWLPLAGAGLHVPFAGHRPRKDLERALELAPRNPRVLLIDALADYRLPASQGGNRERAVPKLRKAVAAFEAERAGGPEPLPGWGAAEAYCALARALMDHGDGVGARDALEHALLLVPDYAQARQLMAKITSG